MKKKITLLAILLPWFMNAQNENFYAGIEIGAKGMKTTILELLNIKKGTYSTIDSWTESTPVGKNISIDGTIKSDDLDKTINLIKENFTKINIEKAVPTKNIIIVVSSGVGMAKNVKEFLSIIDLTLNVKSKLISVEDEVKLMILGGIPVNKINESIMLDIGGGNTKGGYLTSLKDENSYFFSPIKLKYGTVTLTEKIINSVKKKEDFNEYLTNSTKLNDSIKEAFGEMINSNSLIQKKKNYYFSGGAVWAFVTLSQNKDVGEYKEFTIDQVKKHHYDLLTNYSKFEKLAESNPDIQRVLGTYSHQYLISGNNILISFMENIKNIEDKKIYFISNGHLAWLKSYIIETIKGKKEIY
jgi:exopolyphosphatase/pppGpp-phosphohydrolase